MAAKAKVFPMYVDPTTIVGSNEWMHKQLMEELAIEEVQNEPAEARKRRTFPHNRKSRKPQEPR